MNALKTAEGWVGIGFATLLGIGLGLGALIIAGILALAERLKIGAAALSRTHLSIKNPP